MIGVIDVGIGKLAGKSPIFCHALGLKDGLSVCEAFEKT